MQHQETIRRPNGSSLPVLVNALALTSPQFMKAMQQSTKGREEAPQQPEAGQLALVIMQDITALKEAEYLKDEFVGIAAHKLRAPLAVLKGYADMLVVQSLRQPS